MAKATEDIVDKAKAKVAELAVRLSKGPLAARSFESVYGPVAITILLGLDIIGPGEGKPKKYGLAKGKTLPLLADFCSARDKWFDNTVDALIAGAFGELEELGGECREIVENATGGLAETSRITTFGETADTLENISAPTVPKACEKLHVVVLPTKSNRTGRAYRRDAACRELQLAIDRINEEVAEFDEAENKDDAPITEGEKEELEELVGELENAIGEAEGCEFPGMFG